MAVTGKSKNSARTALHDLFYSNNDEKRQNAEIVLGQKLRVPGFDNDTWVITYADGLKLVRLLPNKYTGEIINYVDRTVQQVDAGDQRVHERLDANARNAGVLHELARDGLGLPTLVAADSATERRKRMRDNIEAWSDANKAVDQIYRPRLAWVGTVLDMQERTGELTTKRKRAIGNSVQRLCTQRMTCENLLDSIYITNAPVSGAIMDAETAVTYMPIDIREMIARLGYTCVESDLPALGTKFKVAYVARYGDAPICQTETVRAPSGKEYSRTVNQYLEKDSDLVKNVIRAFYSKRAEAAA
jgi:hypothetical protein